MESEGWMVKDGGAKNRSEGWMVKDGGQRIGVKDGG
jgi:hypothetical protein